MSKQDDHFFNVFGAVIGILVAVTVALFVLARMLGAGDSRNDPLQQAEVAGRTAAFGQVAVAGQDNSALAILPTPSAGDAADAGLTASLPADGPATYEAVCGTCHANGIGGAPKMGDRQAWSTRIAQGTDTLNKHAIEGYQGSAGYMPAKGGRADLTDELVAQAVQYMVEQSR
ncbi:MAG: c-type cytochrome [Steroidobacteraceae bacterium]